VNGTMAYASFHRLDPSGALVIATRIGAESVSRSTIGYWSTVTT
jgi:hypothetical protein